MIHFRSSSVSCTINLEEGERHVEEKKPYQVIYLDGVEVPVPVEVYNQFKEILKNKIK